LLHRVSLGSRGLVILTGITLLIMSAFALGATQPSAPTRADDCGTLQARIDRAPAASLLDLTGCTFAEAVAISKPLTIMGGTVHVPAGRAGIAVAADDVTIDGMTVTGAQSSTYDAAEVGIAVRADAASPVRNLTIRNCTISRFGGVGTSLLNVRKVVVERNRIYDIVYAGVMVLSGDGGVISSNDIERIGLQGSEANAGNAYGITLTRMGGALDVAPPTVDFVVSDNLIENVPTWHALDTHAGRRIAFTNNTVRESIRSVFITTDGADHRPSDITVSGNILEAPTELHDNLEAITTFASDNVLISGNTATGWKTSQFFEDFGGSSTGLVVRDNVVLP
jgi:hypothetical protein